MKEKLSLSRGSITVEASLVFPVAIMTVILLLTLSLKLYEKVRFRSLCCSEYSYEIINPVFSAESVLRYKWLGINIIFKTEF